MTDPQDSKPHFGASQPQDFARLARRMTDWTSKGLFSALVLVGGLGFGRQVIRWWHDEEAAPAAAEHSAAVDLPAAGTPVEFAAGDSNLRFGRLSIAADEAEARKSLRDLCRRALATAAPWSASADAEERAMLSRLAKFEPVMQLEQANARLYEPAPGALLVVGVRRVAGARKGGSENATSWQDRVVLWGLAAPAGPREWTLYQFRADSPAGVDERGGAPPLPPDGRRIMGFRDRQGAETIAFQGTGGCDEYRRFYSAWQAEQRFPLAGQWRRAGEGWQISLIRESSVEPAEGPKSLVIHLAPGPSGGSTGLIFVTR
ncbi:MAG TPA: hypothetical protein VHB99_06400 [Pirellulales bacterium]|nr:hypothetical protein [Pirellulales bacterium]